MIMIVLVLYVYRVEMRQ